MRWLIAVGLLACGGNDTAKPGSAAPSPPAVSDGATHQPPPPTPSLPPIQAAPGAFDSQRRDEDWAPGAERELGRRLVKIHGTLEAAECRRDLCRLTVAGSKADIGKAIDDLEKLRGYAGSILLTNPEPRPDGSLGLVAYAMFER